jgi:hypothetical protein
MLTRCGLQNERIETALPMNSKEKQNVSWYRTGAASKRQVPELVKFLDSPKIPQTDQTRTPKDFQ